ncbi:unnamed protein product [Polarella glacialis]|uniref:Uncharacterized protein n=1 Tax=Polarella glacialis TaxID=89957 RepID=A0A813IVY5_POLGL|nr:unnamed protein product [Polarella glacialis]
MGWTWALCWCQSVHERIVNEVGADDSNRLTDKRPAPSTTPALHTEYVDNFHVFGTDKKEVKELSFRGAQALRNKGLVVHEEEFHDPATGSSATVLGWEFTPQNIMRPSRHRLGGSGLPSGPFWPGGQSVTLIWRRSLATSPSLPWRGERLCRCSAVSMDS